MRPLVRCLVVVFAGLSLGCDAGPNPPKDEPSEIPTIEEVQLTVSTDGHSWQSVSAHRGPEGAFEAEGALLLRPGSRDIDLEVYADTGSVTDYLNSGPDEAVLRFEMADTLEDRILVKGGDPNLLPFDPTGTSSRRADRYKRSPPPRPGLHLCVKDTSAARGALRLVLEQYAEFSPREEQEPTRIDFDATFPLRIVPYADRDANVPCWTDGW